MLALTTFDDDELVFESIEAGAAGYLLKDVGADGLAHAIRAAARGESPLQPSIARKVLDRLRAGPLLRSPQEPALRESRTSRERDVLALLGTGASNREIGDILGLTEGTVKNHVSSILGKTDLRDRTQAALFALRNRPA